MKELIFELKSKLGLSIPQISVESMKVYDGQTGKKFNTSDELNFNRTIIANRLYPKIIVPFLTTEDEESSTHSFNEFTNLQPNIAGVIRFAKYELSGITTKGFKYSLKEVE